MNVGLGVVVRVGVRVGAEVGVGVVLGVGVRVGHFTVKGVINKRLF